MNQMLWYLHVSVLPPAHSTYNSVRSTLTKNVEFDTELDGQASVFIQSFCRNERRRRGRLTFMRYITQHRRCEKREFSVLYIQIIVAAECIINDVSRAIFGQD